MRKLIAAYTAVQYRVRIQASTHNRTLESLCAPALWGASLPLWGYVQTLVTALHHTVACGCLWTLETGVWTCGHGGRSSARAIPTGTWECGTAVSLIVTSRLSHSLRSGVSLRARITLCRAVRCDL